MKSNKRTYLWAMRSALAGLVCTVAACSSTGFGHGSVESDQTAVEFDWTSQDGGRTGMMSAWIGFGLPFKGPFGEVNRATPDGLTQAGLIGELRDPAKGSTGNDGSRPDRTEVLADLTSPERHTLLCSLHVNVAARGMRSGAKGECLLDGASRVEASFPARPG